MKTYDREYYRRWYEDPETRIATREGLARKVAFAVAAAEFMLARRVESVLDVGCGEGTWRAPLRKLRPKATYVGVESSEYVIAKYGKGASYRCKVNDLPLVFDESAGASLAGSVP